jgi:hypothetical protein
MRSFLYSCDNLEAINWVLGRARAGTNVVPTRYQRGTNAVPTRSQRGILPGFPRGTGGYHRGTGCSTRFLGIRLELLEVVLKGHRVLWALWVEYFAMLRALEGHSAAAQMRCSKGYSGGTQAYSEGTQLILRGCVWQRLWWCVGGCVFVLIRVCVCVHLCAYALCAFACVRERAPL